MSAGLVVLLISSVIIFGLPLVFTIALSNHRLYAFLYFSAASCSLIFLILLCLDCLFGLKRAGRCSFNAERAAETVVDDTLLSTASENANSTFRRLSVQTVDPRENANPSHGKQSERIRVPRVVESAPPDPREAISIYSPLLNADIRLLQILPSSTEFSPLRFKLLHVPLFTARARRYAALSYTWGTEAATSTIFLDEKEMRVRPNLARVLRRMRTLYYDFVWVDAICINQADLRECSAQVLRMRGIYAGAQSVLAAIDATSEDEESILQLAALVDPTLGLENQAAAVYDYIKDETTLTAFRVFCNDGYWKRIWIVQEFAIGHALDLLVGNSIVRAAKMDTVLALLARQPHTQRWERANAIFDIRRSWQRKKPMPLLDVLYDTRRSLCGRRHDRVFGLMGLVADGLEFLSEPSYEINLSDLSTSMTRSYIERHSLDIILLAPHRELRSTLPSWSPDYFRYDRYPPDRRIYDLSMSHRHHDDPDTPGHQTVKTWSATGNAPAAVLFMGTALGSSARQIGSIRSLGRAWSDPNGSDFPKHDTTWARGCSQVDITKLMYDAILKEKCEYNQPLDRQHRWFRLSRTAVEIYCYTHAFLEKHGNCDAESSGNDFARWLCANRKFFVGGRFLGDHARRLRHPLFHCGLAAWHEDVLTSDQTGLFHDLREMASNNMRLMCLDNASFGIGWAAIGARIHDEIFLLPGCSSPVILRRHEADGQYKLVGDAIVLGAMKSEVWGSTTPADLVDIEIH